MDGVRNIYHVIDDVPCCVHDACCVVQLIGLKTANLDVSTEIGLPLVPFRVNVICNVNYIIDNVSSGVYNPRDVAKLVCLESSVWLSVTYLQGGEQVSLTVLQLALEKRKLED